jgi:hypothetical protein
MTPEKIYSIPDPGYEANRSVFSTKDGIEIDDVGTIPWEVIVKAVLSAPTEVLRDIPLDLSPIVTISEAIGIEAKR